MTVTELLRLAGAVFAIGGWLLYFNERERSRDYATDLAQLIHDYDLTDDDLRRSTEHGETRQYVSRRGDDD